MKKLLNFLKPSEGFVFLLIIWGVPGFLLIWLLIDFKSAFWLLIFFITSGYFTFLFGFGDPWGGTILNKLRFLIGSFFFMIWISIVLIGGAFILGGLIFLPGGSDVGDCAPPNFYDCGEELI